MDESQTTKYYTQSRHKLQQQVYIVQQANGGDYSLLFCTVNNQVE